MVILCYENFVELNKKHEYISYISKVYKNHIFCACKFLYTIINVQQIDGVIVIYTQLTFGSLDNCLCNNTRDNIIEFPIKKVKNYNENLEFTRHGKPKAKSANSVKTLEEIEKHVGFDSKRTGKPGIFRRLPADCHHNLCDSQRDGKSAPEKERNAAKQYAGAPRSHCGCVFCDCGSSHAV